MTTNSSAKARPEGSPLRKAVGVLSAAVIVALLTTPVFQGALFLQIAISRYDSSGAGGPFAACTATSTSCSGPNVPMALLLSLLLLAAVVVPAVLGQLVGRFRHRAVAIGTLSVAAIIGYGIGSVLLLTVPAALRQ